MSIQPNWDVHLKYYIPWMLNRDLADKYPQILPVVSAL